MQAIAQRKIRAIAFDIDGTLTPFSRFEVPASLRKKLMNLPADLPVAICSGRKLWYIKEKFADILTGPNRFAFCENGGVAYRYNPDASSIDSTGLNSSGKLSDGVHEGFEELCKISWPEEKMSREEFGKFINKGMGPFIHIRVSKYSMVTIYPSFLYKIPRLVRFVSGRSARKLRHILKKAGFNETFDVLDSGIGNIILPRTSGKGNAMQRWAEHLGIPVSQIITVGDQAGPGENDEDFLSGENGTAFTVGKLTDRIYPLPVLGPDGESLSGPAGTSFLLDQLNV